MTSTHDFRKDLLMIQVPIICQTTHTSNAHPKTIPINPTNPLFLKQKPKTKLWESLPNRSLLKNINIQQNALVMGRDLVQIVNQHLIVSKESIFLLFLCFFDSLFVFDSNQVVTLEKNIHKNWFCFAFSKSSH